MRILQEAEHHKPDKTVVYFFMAMAMGGLVFFVYNWWKCRKNRVIEEQYDDDSPEYAGANIYQKSPYNN